MDTSSKPKTNVEKLMEGKELVSMGQLTRQDCADAVKQLVDSCRPYLKYVGKFTSISGLTQGRVQYSNYSQMDISEDERCIIVFDFDYEDNDWFKAPDGTDTPGLQRGKRILLTQAGVLLLYTWEHTNHVLRKGKYVGDPFEIVQSRHRTSLTRFSTDIELADTFTATRVFELAVLLKKIAQQTVDERKRRLEPIENLSIDLERTINSMNFHN